MQPNYTYYKNIIAEQSYPLALVDMDLLDQNIQLLQEQAQGLPIRIASKSVRCRYLLDYIKNKLEYYTGLMTYHGEEALWLAEESEDHILMGYPIVDEALLIKIGTANSNEKNIVLMIDDAQHIQQLERLGQTFGFKFKVCVDIDLSVDFGPLHFGVWRSPLVNIEKLEVFLNTLEQAKHIQLEGLMGYEAQIAGVGDQVKSQKVKSTLIRLLKRRSLPKIHQWRAEAVQKIRDKGHSLVFVNGGGTGSILQTKKERDITEVAVGSGFYSPHLFDYYEDFQLNPAAFFAVQIVRQAKPGVFTCHGGGYLSSGGMDKFRLPKIHLLPGAKMDINEGAGEVQTPIFYTGSEKLNLGDPIFFRHSKAGELCERFNKLYLIRKGKIIKSVKTYRGEQKCFL